MPPVRFQISQLSIVPAQSSPRRRAPCPPGAVVEQPASLLAENSGSIVRPVAASRCARGRAAQRLAEVRRPPALPDDHRAHRLPGRASQTRTDSRWLVTATASIRAAARRTGTRRSRPPRFARSGGVLLDPARLRERDRHRPARASRRRRRRSSTRSPSCSSCPDRSRACACAPSSMLARPPGACAGGPVCRATRRRGCAAVSAGSARAGTRPSRSGANTPGTPRSACASDESSTTTSATAPPSPPYTVCSSIVTMGPRSAAASIAAVSIGRTVDMLIDGRRPHPRPREVSAASRARQTMIPFAMSVTSRPLRSDGRAADLEAGGLSVHVRHRHAAHADEDRTVELRDRADGLRRLHRVGRHDHRHASDRPHPGDVLDRVVRRARARRRPCRSTSRKLDVVPAVGEIDLDLLERPPGQEAARRRRRRESSRRWRALRSTPTMFCSAMPTLISRSGKRRGTP